MQTTDEIERICDRTLLLEAEAHMDLLPEDSPGPARCGNCRWWFRDGTAMLPGLGVCVAFSSLADRWECDPRVTRGDRDGNQCVAWEEG